MSQKVISVSCRRYDCFANDSGGCSILTANCTGACKFFKTREQFERDRERAAHKSEERSAVISEDIVYIQSEKPPSGGESLEISEQDLIDMYINGHQKEGESNGE